MKLSGKIQQVPISRIVENPWNYNKMTDEMFAKQLASLDRHGFIGVTIVREIVEAGKPFFQIIDGAHRFRAAKERGAKKLRVNNLGKISDAKAKELTLTLQEVRGKKQKGMFESLVDELGMSLSDEEMLNLPVPDALVKKLDEEAKEAEDAMVDIDFDTESGETSNADEFMSPFESSSGNKSSASSEPKDYPARATVTLHFSEEDWEEKGPGILSKIESVCKKAGGYSEDA